MAALMVSSALLSGCAEANLFGHIAKTATADGSKPPPATATVAPTVKFGNPYQVAGVWYYPDKEYHEYDETGIASYYAEAFHNKVTANGETFDMNAVTAAHKTLPLPSVVRVTNLENGRSLVVRVNDRGPFVNGRIIDLSRRSAQMLGMERQGTAPVRVTLLMDETMALVGNKREAMPNETKVAAAPRTSVAAETLPAPGSKEAPAPVKVASHGRAQRGMSAEAVEHELANPQVKETTARASGIFVQAGSFSRHDNALRLSARLSGVGKAQIQQASVQGHTVYRVRIGPVPTVDEADRLLDAVIATGQQDARVVVD